VKKPTEIRSSGISVEGLVEETLQHALELAYSPHTLGKYQRTWQAFLKFAQQEGMDGSFSQDLVARYLASRGIFEEQKGRLRPGKNYTRSAMRVLSEFAKHGCFQRRSKIDIVLELSSTVKKVIKGYQQFCTEYLRLQPRTTHGRTREIKRFLHFIKTKISSIPSIEDINPALISEFVASRVHLNSLTLGRILCGLRSFFRYLCMRGILSEDLAEHVPRIRVRPDARIPSVWTPSQITALLNAVDRSSPKGKRDYAILLLACRLGLRVGDIRKLRLSELRWDEDKIELQQAKTGESLTLPLADEVGKAIIDYLQHGRPETTHNEVFLGAAPPFRPFAENNNLYGMINFYRRRAGITLPQRARAGLHSLRHSLATRLLEIGTSIETIAEVLGHRSVESTRIYAKVDIEALRSAALDPDDEML